VISSCQSSTTIILLELTPAQLWVGYPGLTPAQMSSTSLPGGKQRCLSTPREGQFEPPRTAPRGQAATGRAQTGLGGGGIPWRHGGMICLSSSVELVSVLPRYAAVFTELETARGLQQETKRWSRLLPVQDIIKQKVMVAVGETGLSQVHGLMAFFMRGP
jgi:hypothetical protein